MAEENKNQQEELNEEEVNLKEEEVLGSESEEEDSDDSDDVAFTDNSSDPLYEDNGPQYSKTGKEIQRGAKLRRELAMRLPDIEYPDSISTKRLDLKSWLSPIMDLKSQEFLWVLNKIIPKKK